MNEPASKPMQPEPQGAKPPSGVGAIFQTAIISALVSGGMIWALMQREIVPLKAELASRPPVAVVDFGALANGLQKADPSLIDQQVLAMRQDIKKLSDAGFMVLDAQSVLGAPADMFLQLQSAPQPPGGLRRGE